MIKSITICITVICWQIANIRGEIRALIGGGGGEYSYLLVLPDEFLLKSAVIKVNFKRNSSGRTRIYEYSPPPPPINALVSPLANMDLDLFIQLLQHY